MKLQITPTTDGKLQPQFTTLVNPITGKSVELSVQDALYWGNRMIQINKSCGGDPDFAVRIGESCNE